MKKLVLFLVFINLILLLSSSELDNYSTKDFIKISPVIKKTFVRNITGYGYIKARKNRQVAIYTDGVIKDIFVKNGEKIKKGEKLFSFEGYYKLKEQATGIGSKSGNDKNFIIIKSPATGYVANLSKASGNTVKSGEVILSIIDLKNPIAEIPLPQEDKPEIGYDAQIYFENKKYEGKVIFVSVNADKQTGNIIVGIEISDKKNNNLLPGNFVKASIILKSHKNVPAVPKTAILSDKNSKYVIVKNGDIYKKRKIITGWEDLKFIEIKSGLKVGEKVVTQGSYEIFNKDINNKLKVGD